MKKKGFTLIELIAVITLLATVMLIATPIILGVINDAKKNAAIDSMYLYIKSIEMSVNANPKVAGILEGTYTTKDNDLYQGGNKVLKVQAKGDKPADNGTVIMESGDVVEARLSFNGYNVVYKNKKAKVVDEETTPPVETKSFAEDSWETIVEAVKSGNTSNYHVGDTKEIDLGAELGTHTLRIANMSNNDPVCSNSNYSQTACGFVLEFADIITEHKMKSAPSSVGGWPTSLIRVYVNDTIYNALPAELRSGIIDTRVVSGHGSGDAVSANFTSTDKLYLLSTKEVWNGSDGYDTAEEETRQLDYYKNLGVTTSNYAGAKKNYNGGFGFWWLRSAYSRYATCFYYVISGGKLEMATSNDSNGVAPAFRIG